MRIFNEISLQNVRGDIFGGITAALACMAPSWLVYLLPCSADHLH